MPLSEVVIIVANYGQHATALLWSIAFLLYNQDSFLGEDLGSWDEKEAVCGGDYAVPYN